MADRQLAILLFIVSAVLFAVSSGRPLLLVAAAGALLAGFILTSRRKRGRNSDIKEPD